MFDWFKKAKPFRELSYGSPWEDREAQMKASKDEFGVPVRPGYVPAEDPCPCGLPHGVYDQEKDAVPALGTESIVWHVDVVDKDGSTPFHCDSRPTFEIEDKGDGMYFVKIIDGEGSWLLNTEGYPIISITEE